MTPAGHFGVNGTDFGDTLSKLTGRPWRSHRPFRSYSLITEPTWTGERLLGRSGRCEGFLD